jgi:signal peptidase
VEADLHRDGVMKESRSGRRFLLPLGAIAVATLVPLAIFLGTTWLQGRTLHVVESGSMEPAYPVGSALVVSPVEPSAVRVGMTITFQDPTAPARLVSHRVVEVIERPNGYFFRTRGDANLAADPFPVSGSALRGRVVWHVPKLGSVLLELRWPRGFIALVGVPGLALLLTEIVRHRRRPRPSPPGHAPRADLLRASWHAPA